MALQIQVTPAVIWMFLQFVNPSLRSDVVYIYIYYYIVIQILSHALLLCFFFRCQLDGRRCRS